MVKYIDRCPRDGVVADAGMVTAAPGASGLQAQIELVLAASRYRAAAFSSSTSASSCAGPGTRSPANRGG